MFGNQGYHQIRPPSLRIIIYRIPTMIYNSIPIQIMHYNLQLRPGPITHLLLLLTFQITIIILK